MTAGYEPLDTYCVGQPVCWDFHLHGRLIMPNVLARVVKIGAKRLIVRVLIESEGLWVDRAIHPAYVRPMPSSLLPELEQTEHEYPLCDEIRRRFTATRKIRITVRARCETDYRPDQLRRV